jgi:hypothetical protein
MRQANHSPYPRFPLWINFPSTPLPTKRAPTAPSFRLDIKRLRRRMDRVVYQKPSRLTELSSAIVPIPAIGKTR